MPAGFTSWHSNHARLMLPSNIQHILLLLAAFTVCQVPITFRTDTKLAEAGLHSYNPAAYNSNVETCILGLPMS